MKNIILPCECLRVDKKDKLLPSHYPKHSFAFHYDSKYVESIEKIVNEFIKIKYFKMIFIISDNPNIFTNDKIKRIDYEFANDFIDIIYEKSKENRHKYKCLFIFDKPDLPKNNTFEGHSHYMLLNRRTYNISIIMSNNYFNNYHDWHISHHSYKYTEHGETKEIEDYINNNGFALVYYNDDEIKLFSP